jgi:hypothetical protein
MWQNKTTHTQQFEEAFQYLVGAEYDHLTLQYTDNILTITTNDGESKRNTFVDIYFLDIITALNKTIEVEIELDILKLFPQITQEGTREQ